MSLLSNNRENPHLVFLPSGIGSSTPFLRLAAMAASHSCRVTFIRIQPQTPDPEFANHPNVEFLDLEMQTDILSDSSISDPFVAHIANINRSLYRLNPILSSSQVSAIFSDFAVAATLAQISADLNIPYYVLSTISARFFSVLANLPALLAEDPNVFSNSSGEIEIQGFPPISKSNIPIAWTHNSSTNSLLMEYLLPNARSLSKAKGILLNTFDWFEQETLAALSRSRALNSLPPVFPIGPLKSYESQKSHHLLWLSQQPVESVVYVDFGSREVIPTDQMKELEKGLEICGHKYLWVIKGYKEEGHDSIGVFEGFSGDSCREKNRNGIILREGVDQEKVLADSAIGVFVNECEWDSVVQAAWHGVPTLAWPQHGDQKMNAETVEKAGFGIWIKEWGCGGEGLVEGNEIARVVVKIMGDLNIKKKAKFVKEKAREACEIGGSSENGFKEVMDMVTRNKN